MAAYTALIDLVFRLTEGSTVAVSLTVLVSIGAVGLTSPLGGFVVDRWDRQRAMVASDLLSAVLFLALAAVEPLWLILTVAFLTAVASTPFRAGLTAAVPSLAGDEGSIARANGRLSIGSTLGITLGPAIGGVLVGTIGAGPVFVLNAASFVGSAWLVWSIRAPFADPVPADPEAVPEGRLSGLSAGFRYLARDRVLLVTTLAWMALHVGAGLAIVADRPLADVFGVGSAGFGLLIGIYGLGAVVGAWLGGRLSGATEPTALVAGLAVAGLAGIGVGLAPLFSVVLAFSVVWGVGDSLTTVARSGILQRRTPDAVRGRAAAASESALNLTLMVGFLLAGPVLAAIGPQATYAITGVVGLAAAGLCSTVVATARREASLASIRPAIDP
jgi:predicted MFS family arabinose efflux permease